MMCRKWFKVMSLLSLLLWVALAQAMAAAEDMMTAIPFTVEYAPGTVTIEALKGAPEPKQATFSDAEKGSFELSFTEPGDYEYRIYQHAGNKAGVIYDTTVFEVGIYVRVNADGHLYHTVIVSMDDDSHKPSEIIFRNKPQPTSTPGPSSSTSSTITTPKTGDDNELSLWITLQAVSVVGLGALLLIYVRGKKHRHAE